MERLHNNWPLFANIALAGVLAAGWLGAMSVVCEVA